MQCIFSILAEFCHSNRQNDRHLYLVPVKRCQRSVNWQPFQLPELPDYTQTCWETRLLWEVPNCEQTDNCRTHRCICGLRMEDLRWIGHTKQTPESHKTHVTVWQSDAGPIQDGLGQQVIIAFKGTGCSTQRIPDLLPALERWRRVPELISLAPQLAFGHRVVTFPFRPLSLQGLVTPQSHWR